MTTVPDLRPTCTDSPGRRREVLSAAIYTHQGACGSAPLSSLLTRLWSPLTA
jgi:hypothetical protein